MDLISLFFLVVMMDTDDTRRMTDDRRQTAYDRQRQGYGIYKLPTGELKTMNRYVLAVGL